MRTLERFAMIFGIMNLVMGVVSMMSPFVSHEQHGNFITRRLRRRRQGLINRETGQLFGFMGATNPPMSMLHTAVGAAGLATRARPLSRFSRAYAWITGALFLGLAAMGWARTGFRPGVEHMAGMAVDWKDNLIHTLLGGTALLMATRSDMGMPTIEREVEQAMEEVSMAA